MITLAAIATPLLGLNRRDGVIARVAAGLWEPGDRRGLLPVLAGRGRSSRSQVVAPDLDVAFDGYADRTALMNDSTTFLLSDDVNPASIDLVTSEVAPGHTKSMQYTFEHPGPLMAAGTFLAQDWLSIVSVGTTDFTAIGARVNLANPVPASSIAAGDRVVITSLGTTDWTAIGAASNTVDGKWFVATGPGTGTGTGTIWFNVTGAGTGTGTAHSAGANTVSVTRDINQFTPHRQEVWVEVLSKVSTNWTTGGQVPPNIADPNDYKHWFLIPSGLGALGSSSAGRWGGYLGSGQDPIPPTRGGHGLNIEMAEQPHIGGFNPAKGPVLERDVWTSDQWIYERMHVKHSTTPTSADGLCEYWFKLESGDWNLLDRITGLNTYDPDTNLGTAVAGFTFGRNEDDGTPGLVMHEWWGHMKMWFRNPGWVLRPRAMDAYAFRDAANALVFDPVDTIWVTSTDIDPTMARGLTHGGIYQAHDRCGFDGFGFNILTAGAFVTGRTYTIVSVGTTDFTAIGASSNTVGTNFTATGAGTGTGTATAAVGVANDGGNSYTRAPQLAGSIWNGGGPAFFTPQTPLRAGAARIRLGIGSYVLNPAVRQMYVQLVDNGTPILTVNEPAGPTMGTEFMDATGVIRTSEADWIANNAGVDVTLSGAPLQLIVGSDTTATPLMYFSVEYL